MGTSGQIGARQDEWDQVWQDYDQRRPAVARLQPMAVPRPAAPAPQPCNPLPSNPMPSNLLPSNPALSRRASAAKRRNRGHGLLLAITAGLGLAALFGLTEARRYPAPAPAEAMASLASLAPEEAELPPLTVAVSRLAAESAAAACWVMRLAPQATPWAQPCVEP